MIQRPLIGRLFACTALLLASAFFPACAAQNDDPGVSELAASKVDALDTSSLGKLGGEDFVPASSFATLTSVEGGTWLVIGLSSLPGACTQVKDRTVVAFERRVLLGLAKKNGAIEPGTYPLSSEYSEESWTFATGGVFGADCTEELNLIFIEHEGVVTIDSISADEVKGSFDVTLSNGEHLLGSFSAPRCDPTPSDPDTPAQEQCLPAQ